MASDVPCCGAEFSLYLLIVVGLVCFAGLMAGLTLGLMSLGLVDLEVLIKSGRPQDRIHAGNHLFLHELLIGSLFYFLKFVLYFCQPCGFRSKATGDHCCV